MNVHSFTCECIFDYEQKPCKELKENFYAESTGRTRKKLSMYIKRHKTLGNTIRHQLMLQKVFLNCL